MGTREGPAGWRSSIEILFEDDHLIAAVKPAGLPTANAPAGRPSRRRRRSRPAPAPPRLFESAAVPVPSWRSVSK